MRPRGASVIADMPTISEFDALPAGTRLGEFEIQQVLGVGGFGIVYLALDHALERQVAIKEYMPASLAARAPQGHIQVRSSAALDTYQLGLRSFINEARLLARFDHPSLVKVYRFWEAQGTAYMVMPYYKGRTLQQVRRDMSAPPDEAWLRRLINPLLGALACLHGEQVYHRDVAPDNILLIDDEAAAAPGRPVLLDLGAARRVIGDHTHALTAIVKPSFAPIEQYAETMQLRQGPWTDLYALGAVVHFCVTGRPPIPATARTVHDELPSLRALAPSLARDFDRHFSESFLGAIDHALSVRPSERPESVAAWQAELSGIVAQPDASVTGRATSLPTNVAHTVLVTPESGLMPEGHERVHAQAYMTTVPAASHLSAPPSMAAAGRRVMPEPVGSPLPDLARPVVPEPISVPSALLTEPPAGEAMLDSVASTPPVPAMPEAADDTPGRWGHSGRMWLALGLAAALLAAWGSLRHKPVSPASVQGAPVVASAPSAAAQRVARAASGSRAHKPSAPPTQRETPAAAVADKPDDAPAAEAPTVSKKENKRADASGYRNPRQACGDRMFITRAICMKRLCAKPAYNGHPECERMREQESAQRNVY